MKEVTEAPTCEYANELISFVYSELSDKESQEFKLHLNTCQQCSVEFESFGEMRDAIGVWKYQSLAGVSLAEETREVRLPRMKSAVTAFRAFFDLSPLWLKGAVTFTTVLFCILAVIATGRLNQNVTPLPVVRIERTYTQQEVDSIVAKARADASSSNQTAVVKEDAPQEKVAPKNIERNRTAVPPVARSQRPLSKAEREQLAADLRLTSHNDDTVDLISDRINQ